MSDEFVFSVIIPAHNEENYIGKCIDSIKKSADFAGMKAQIIVVCNRCDDNTAGVAEEMGAVVCVNEDKCISAVRNAGARLAEGRIIVTLDADSVINETALKDIYGMLDSGKYIGGGTNVTFERWSLGIIVSTIYVGMHLAPIMRKHKAYLSGAMFWCYKETFDKLGGFDEGLVSLEDMDFAIRMKQLGDEKGLKYGTPKKARVTTSSRKFDQFGDWYLVKDKELTKAIFTGKDREAADKFYYDVKH